MSNQSQLFPVGLSAMRIPAAGRSGERMRPHVSAIVLSVIFKAPLMGRHCLLLWRLDRRRVQLGLGHLERTRTALDRRLVDLTFSLGMQSRRIVGSWRQMINNLRPGAWDRADLRSSFRRLRQDCGEEPKADRTNKGSCIEFEIGVFHTPAAKQPRGGK